MQDGTHIDFLRWGILPVISAIDAVSTQADQLDWDAIGRDIAVAPETLGVWSVLPPGHQPTASVASAG